MHFLILSKEARTKVSIPDILEQLYELVEYAKKALSLTGVLYLVTWCKTFTALRIKGWNNILLVIRLLLAVPVSNAKLERMVSKLQCVKINCCCSSGVKCLGNILRIMEEGRSWQTFVLISAIKK